MFSLYNKSFFFLSILVRSISFATNAISFHCYLKSGNNNNNFIELLLIRVFLVDCLMYLNILLIALKISKSSLSGLILFFGLSTSSYLCFHWIIFYYDFSPICRIYSFYIFFIYPEYFIIFYYCFYAISFIPFSAYINHIYIECSVIVKFQDFLFLLSL